MQKNLIRFIEKMPKVELHLHIEGSLEPELAFQLAVRNGIVLKRADGTAYESASALRKAYKFSNLQEFLDLYYQGMSVLQTQQDFYDLTHAYLKKVAAQQVRHVEVFFDPQGHTERGVAFETAFKGIHQALTSGVREFGISFKLIMCFLRHKSEEDAFTTLTQAQPFLGQIDGFGLDSSEAPFPPSLFERVFAAARETGKPVVAHAGEEGPAEYVRQALDLLKVSRIDHGNRSLEDPELVKRLAEAKMGLTVCPLSNLRLCVVKDLTQHPLRKMLQAGLLATVNSDDPAYFGGYMNENYLAITDALKLTQEEIVQLARNAIEVSFLSPEAKAKHCDELENYLTAAA